MRQTEEEMGSPHSVREGEGDGRTMVSEWPTWRGWRIPISVIARRRNYENLLPGVLWAVDVGTSCPEPGILRSKSQHVSSPGFRGLR